VLLLLIVDDAAVLPQNDLHQFCVIKSSTRAPFRVSVDRYFNLMEMVFDAMRRGSKVATGASLKSHVFSPTTATDVTGTEPNVFSHPRTTSGKGHFRRRCCDRNECRSDIQLLPSTSRQ